MCLSRSCIFFSLQGYQVNWCYIQFYSSKTYWQVIMVYIVGNLKRLPASNQPLKYLLFDLEFSKNALELLSSFMLSCLKVNWNQVVFCFYPLWYISCGCKSKMGDELYRTINYNFKEDSHSKAFSATVFCRRCRKNCYNAIMSSMFF